jgi:hypothetical protein
LKACILSAVGGPGHGLVARTGKIKSSFLKLPGATMSQHTDHSAHASHDPAHEPDAIEAIVPMMPIVLPLVGGVLMFLLAFIAVFLA